MKNSLVVFPFLFALLCGRNGLAAFAPCRISTFRGPSRPITHAPYCRPLSVSTETFEVRSHQYENKGSKTIVFEVPVKQEGVKMFIANDGILQTDRPGNGGMRLLSYKSDEDAIADAVRLAEGMTRKHAMYNTGFSGAKLVVDHGNVDLSDVDRKSLMKDCAEALLSLEGAIYTGCDINTHEEDMECLISYTPYVLAGIGSTVDTNVATAMSVIGSIMGILESHDEDIQGKSFLVQGCGKVGSHVAAELVRRGARQVKTCDLDKERADIAGCIPLAEDEPWYMQKDIDFLVPCANSLAINEEVLEKMVPPPKFIVGATNQPYASAKIRAAFDAKGSLHVPESISSAGAILADSIEWTNPELFRRIAEPAQVYGWIRDLSKTKARDLCRKANNDARKIHAAVNDVYADAKNGPIGQTFPQWIQENSFVTDCVVLGGGMAGTAAAYANAKAGVKTLLLEQGNSLAPKIASSNGDSRMYRQMYSDQFFSKMQTAALDLWKILEDECGEKLLHQNGLLFYGEDTGETVEGSVEGARKTMEDLGLPHEFYASGEDIHERFPALNTRGTPYSGVYEETAGHVRSSAACEAMVRVAELSGKCTSEVNCKVEKVNVISDDAVEVVLQDGRKIVSKSLVLAAGPWTNEVLEKNFGLKLDLDIWRVHWAHYEIDENINVPQCFFFRKESECGNDGGLYYCFPASATESCANASPGKKVIKVGVDFKTTKPIDKPESMDMFSYDTMEDVLNMMDRFVQEHLQDGSSAIRIEDVVSPYTMTKDSYFVIDTLPDHKNVAIFSGGSGRAFKFAPLIGDCLSRLLRGDPDLKIDNMSRFSITRPGLGLKKLCTITKEDAEPSSAVVSGIA